MEIHWFPEDPPKKGCWFEMVFLIGDSNIQNSNTTPSSWCPKLKFEVLHLYGTHTQNQTIWSEKSMPMCPYVVNQGITERKNLAALFSTPRKYFGKRQTTASGCKGRRRMEEDDFCKDGHRTPENLTFHSTFHYSSSFFLFLMSSALNTQDQNAC